MYCIKLNFKLLLVMERRRAGKEEQSGGRTVSRETYEKNKYRRAMCRAELGEGELSKTIVSGRKAGRVKRVVLLVQPSASPQSNLFAW